MKLRQLILAEHSRSQCTMIIKWIGKDQRRFDELVTLVVNDETVVEQRAAWPLSEISLQHPEMVHKHLGILLKNLKRPGIHDSVKRNTVSLLNVVPLPKKRHGIIMNLCFDFILDPVEKPAVKAFSLTVLERLVKEYPDIKQELKTIIEDRWENESTAFKSRARKLLKSL